jgi:hypothetical protein
MSGRTMRVGLLGLLVLLLTGSYAPTAAYAGGPYYYHRGVGEKGKGVKISENSPEGAEGKGGEQKWSGEIAKTPIEITAKQVKIKEIIYNNVNQGQAKFELTYAEPVLVTPKLPECKVTIGTNDTLHLDGYSAWRWNGTKAQLLEYHNQHTIQHADMNISLNEPKYTEAQEEEGKELPEDTETFMEIKFSASGCGVLSGADKVNGADVTTPESPVEFEEWSQTEKLNSAGGGAAQHFCFFVHRDRPVPCGPIRNVSLMLDGDAFEYKGEFEMKEPKQEVAFFEE